MYVSVCVYVLTMRWQVWEHPNSDKLWMEQVEVGDKYPKQIASGLRAHYTQEEMDGRRILVVTNLKTAKLGGETSSGMVLCAKEGDKAVFVEPPADAKVRFLDHRSAIIFCGLSWCWTCVHMPRRWLVGQRQTLAFCLWAGGRAVMNFCTFNL